MNRTTIAAPKRVMNRRQFLKTASAAAGMVTLGSCATKSPGVGAETLETTTIRLTQSPSLCTVPLYLADDLLKSEGFTNVEYIKTGSEPIPKLLVSGAVDLTMTLSAPLITRLDAGDPIKILSGVHIGCFELFGTDQVRTIRDLKGKTLAITELGGNEHVFLSVMAAYVGLDPQKDIEWVTLPQSEIQQRFAEGKIDAFLAFPPQAQELKAKKIGHLVVNSMMDKPWSQYFCCMAAANSDFVKTKPIAAKRALRALLKATDICALQPDRAARYMVDKGYVDNYDYALEAMRDIPFNHWRDYDPEDTLRFYALRLNEAGMVKTSPEEIIARSADWRFFNEIKAEYKESISMDFSGASSANEGLLPFFCRL